MRILIAGAGPAGLFCAGLLAEKHDVTVIDIGSSPGRKLLISGGGKCNFTNMELSSDNFISSNPHFCKSAISRYSQYDVIELLSKHRIAYETRDFGRLFCRNSANDVLDMLLAYCKKLRFVYNCELQGLREGFIASTSNGDISADAQRHIRLPKALICQYRL